MGARAGCRPEGWRHRLWTLNSGVTQKCVSGIGMLLVLGCNAPVRSDVLEPALRTAVADPAVLAELCGVEAMQLGAVSPSRLELSDVRNSRSGNAGKGSATVRYRPLSGPHQDETCEGRVSFAFNDGGGARVDAGTIQIEQLSVVPAGKG